MKFALNYSPEAANLLKRGQIEVDVYKCPNWPDMIAQASVQRPVYVHFPLMAGRDNIDQIGLENIERFLEQTGTHYVNTHLAPNGRDFGIPLESDDPRHAERLAEAMLGDIRRLSDRFGPERVILENVPWDPDPKYSIPCIVLGIDFIRRMVYESGCGFLLDSAHASIAARYFGVDEREYIAALPVDRLRELHITGLQYSDEAGFWVDHFPMTDEDWTLAEWALANIHAGKWPRPWAVVLEYGGSGPAFAYRSKPDVIAADAPRLYALTHPVREQD